MRPTTLEEFEASLSANEPPAGLQGPLQALWWQGKGEWERAHALVMDDSSLEAAWVHAHLHRAEGDQDNAAVWYRRAGQSRSEGGLREEWRTIASALLAG